MARTRPGGGRTAAFVMVVTALCLAGGCGSSRDDAADVTVVKVKFVGKGRVGLWYLDGNPEDVFQITRDAKTRGATTRGATTRPAGDSTEKALKLVIPPGGLLRVVVRGPDDENGHLCFPYRCDGAEEQPLVFSRSGFQGTVNGKTVHLDLTTSEAIAWLAKQPASATKTVRSIRLSGDSPDDAKALSHFAGSGLIVWFDFAKGFKTVKQPALIRALIAARPSGLFAPGGENLDEPLAELPDLEYLCSSGQRIPNLTPLRKLRFFGFKFDETSPGSLAPLAGAAGLQGLCLLQCKGTTDFKPIAELSDLRRLELGAPKMEDLSVLSDMKKLRRLMLACEGLKDISGVRDLQSLREAAFISIPDTLKDLTPLENLKGLRILIVDKKALKKRKVEFDRIDRALPDTEIVGFCMGSAWIFLPILAAGFALLRHRRKVAASYLT